MGNNVRMEDRKGHETSSKTIQTFSFNTSLITVLKSDIFF